LAVRPRLALYASRPSRVIILRRSFCFGPFDTLVNLFRIDRYISSQSFLELDFEPKWRLNSAQTLSIFYSGQARPRRYSRGMRVASPNERANNL
jgi:hypothetical protein